MAEFLQECYLSAGEVEPLAGKQQRIEAAAARLTEAGSPIRLIRSIVVPEDETWFLLWEAEAEQAVREVCRRARIGVGRITRSVALPLVIDDPA